MDGEFFSDLLAAVRQQIDSPQTPYVGETFQRLVAAGLSKDDALEQIAVCLGDEMENIALERRAFDEAAYRAALNALPMEENPGTEIE
ncbi:MAG: hypothetical protein V4733_12000 [Verrucomicrobiota bacterium]